METKSKVVPSPPIIVEGDFFELTSLHRNDVVEVWSRALDERHHISDWLIIEVSFKR